MKKLSLSLAALFFVWMVDSVQSQTVIQGKLLSADGRTIPKTVISIEPENKRDIFEHSYKNIVPGEDGSYQFEIEKPGLYRIIFRGVFHYDLWVPVMIYDQPSMNMNVLLLPVHFNDGTYFDNDEYLEWIRVVGNFNDYDYNTGKQFSLNSDGSISAFIPVNSDTIRYHVRGITYNQSATVLPQADEYNYREDVGFESVLYNDLPNDSLEIRYDPDEKLPFKRHFPIGVNPMQVHNDGFISLRNQNNENWIRPLSILQHYNTAFNFVEWEMSTGIPIESQITLQKNSAGNIFNIDFSEELEYVNNNFGDANLHPQQKALLSMSYVSMLGWIERRTMIQQRRSEDPNLKKIFEEEQIPKINPDPEIIQSIPEIVSPVHPAWRYNNGAVDYLLSETGDPEKFLNYFYDVVRNHPNERAVELITLYIIRHFCHEYSSVEEMPVYQLILNRYGENDVARTAQLIFRNQTEE